LHINATFSLSVPNKSKKSTGNSAKMLGTSADKENCCSE